MVFAKTSKAASRLSNEIRLNNVHKTYLAIVHGHPANKGTFVDYLKKMDDFNTIVSPKTDGKYAELSYELVEYQKTHDISLVKVFLKTGRHHQIRVQFQSRGYPLVGDNRYGHDKVKEIGLFAYQLSFKHPVKNELMTFTAYPATSWFNKFNFIKEHKL